MHLVSRIFKGLTMGYGRGGSSNAARGATQTVCTGIENDCYYAVEPFKSRSWAHAGIGPYLAGDHNTARNQLLADEGAALGHGSHFILLEDKLKYGIRQCA